MLTLATVERILVNVLPVIFAITLHEAAHGWVAWRRGDSTARDLGRVSANPLRHIDPIGTVLVPALMIIFTPYVFGWAKPVPVVFERLYRPRRDMALVALAGPVANLLMGIAWALVVRLAVVYHVQLGSLANPLVYMGLAGIFVNTIIMVLNLLPLPPLDGGRILVSALPPPLANIVSRVEPFGLLVMVALLASGTLWSVLGPPVGLVTELMGWVAGDVPASVL